MTRGFVTLATGKDCYYKMSVNMLKSFRLHNPEAKMAILCDRENEFTKHFDDVVILPETYGDYRDKFRLLVDSPYDENFFIEPDCLVYNNLDFFWNKLGNGKDFSAFGWNDSSLSTWFKSEEAVNEIKKHLPQIETMPLFNPGYFFVRRGSACDKMFSDCMNVSQYIVNNPILNKEESLFGGKNLRDDPILCLAMEMNEFVCNAKPSAGLCMSLPSKYTIDKIDIRNGALDVTDSKGKKFNDCSLLHFSTRKANEEGLYPWQITIMNMSYEGKPAWLINIIDSKLVLKLFEIHSKIKRIIKRLIK